MIIVAGMIGYFIGAIVSWYVCKPGKSFQKGWNAAKQHYGNYERGFNDGWDACASSKITNDALDKYFKNKYGIGYDDAILLQLYKRDN